MAITLINSEQSKVISSIDTYNYTVLVAGMYMVKCEISEIPTSSISVLLKQNGSTKATSAVPAAAQQLVSIQTVMNCAINDVIGVAISSSAAIEAAPNQIKGIINIHQGSF